MTADGNAADRLNEFIALRAELDRVEQERDRLMARAGELIRDTERQVGVSEISRILEFSRPTIYRIGEQMDYDMHSSAAANAAIAELSRHDITAKLKPRSVHRLVDHFLVAVQVPEESRDLVERIMLAHDSAATRRGSAG